MYQQPYGYGQGAPGLAPGLSAPSGYNVPLIPPNFNFNAPVIHFGQTLSGATTISTPQPSALAATPIARPTFVREPEGPRLAPTAEDQLQTIFVGDIPDDLADDWMDRICRALGKLKEWRRATDGADKPRQFGFAIFEDAESTNRAYRMLQEFEIPSLQPGKPASKLMIRIDDSTVEYLSTLGAGDSSTDGRDDDIRAYLARVMEELKDPGKRQPKQESKGDQAEDGQPDIDEADYVPEKAGMTVLISGDDDPSVMPNAQREVILKEIAAFRERSNRRDKNKMWFEEEEKAKSNKDRDASPIQGDSKRQTKASQDARDEKRARAGSDSIPSGPAADRRRPPREYHQPVRFRTDKDREEDEDIPDEELERRRQERKTRDLETTFIARERKWFQREKLRLAAQDREKDRENKRNRNDVRPTIDKDTMLVRLLKFDDDMEAEKQSEEYYKDHQSWARTRVEIKRKETEKDDRDRATEDREISKGKSRAAALADSFLDSNMGDVLSSVPQPLRLRMTRENIKTAPASPAKRSVDEVEGLLEEDEEDEDYRARSRKKRLLVPLEYEGEESRKRVEENERSKEDQLRNLVSSIPSDTKGLWEYPVHWDGLDNTILEGKIRPFATKKIIEAFGIQEQDLIDFVVDHISKHGSAEALAQELEMTLDEEAEIFVKKMWRMLILETESKKRKIAT